MIAQDVNINDFYWGLKNKFKLDIGIKNTINPKYPNIIWFKQGIFIITSFSTSQGVNNFTINISGKDKMCMLNGDVSGSLPHSTDFGIEEIIDNETGVTTYNSIPIKNIIREAVQNFGGELAHNIVINDLEDAGLILLEYRGDQPIYMLYDIQKGVYTNITTRASTKCYIKVNDEYIGPYSIDNQDGFIKYRELSELMTTDSSVISFSNDIENSVKYNITKVEYGEVCGYKLTDLTYAGDLIANVGESLTSVLDKIKNMLGDFEYFYDIDGRFIFRKRPTYISAPWDSSETDELIIPEESAANSKIFNFTNGHLITSFSNTPNLLNLKNDFSVWGKSKMTSGAEVPIHMRYVLDKKPTSYLPIRPLKQEIVTTTINDDGTITSVPEEKFYNAPSVPPYDDIPMYHVTNKNIQINDHTTQDITSYYALYPFTSQDYDWRELIFQMALDYRKFSHDDDFIFKMKSSSEDYVNGKTGYESYYTDLEGFWRDLYNPNPELKLTRSTAARVSELDANMQYINGFRLLTDKEKEEISLDKINNYYIFATAINDNVERLYPFKKGYCRLQKDTPYFYMTAEGKMNQGTKDEKILNDVNIDSIYVENGEDEDGNTKYMKYIEFCLHDAVNKDLIYVIEEKMLLSEVQKDIKIKTLLEKYPEVLTYKDVDNYGNIKNEIDYTIAITYYEGYYDYYLANEENAYWRKDVVESPENLIFWFDFLDVEGADMAKYSVQAIGSRSKAINDSDVKSIYYRTVPPIIYLSGTDSSDYELKTGYSYAQLPYYMENLFVTSSKGKSAKERIDELLYDHLYCVESANISSVPVYNLEPNGKVYIKDDKSGINGEYNISKITLPLAYNGTMSLTATKTVPSDMLIF